MVIGQWSSCDEYPFFAEKTEFVGNLLTANEDEPINTPQGRARPKPILYKELIKLLTSPGQWVFDPLSGIGTHIFIIISSRPTRMNHSRLLDISMQL